jgi:hypothetical protein
MAESDDSTSLPASPEPPTVAIRRQPDGVAVAEFFTTIDTTSVEVLLTAADSAMGAAGHHHDRAIAAAAGQDAGTPSAQDFPPGFYNALGIAYAAVERVLALVCEPPLAPGVAQAWIAGQAHPESER